MPHRSNELIALPDVYGSFERIARPHERGFETVRPGLYCRTESSDYRYVLKLYKGQGGSVILCWGLCLTYLPMPSGNRLRWHRTLKATRLHLFEMAPEALPSGLLNWRAMHYIDTLGGVKSLLKTTERVWLKAAPVIQRWFESIQTLNDVVALADEHCRRRGDGVGHHPDPHLPLAFTLARIGREDEARDALDVYMASGGLNSAQSELLFRALDAA